MRRIDSDGTSSICPLFHRLQIPPGPQNPQATAWSDPDRVDWYLTRIGGLAPRGAGEEVLVSVLPESPHTVLDLGPGEVQEMHLLREADKRQQSHQLSHETQEHGAGASWPT